MVSEDEKEKRRRKAGIWIGTQEWQVCWVKPQLQTQRAHAVLSTNQITVNCDKGSDAFQDKLDI